MADIIHDGPVYSDILIVTRPLIRVQRLVTKRLCKFENNENQNQILQNDSAYLVSFKTG